MPTKDGKIVVISVDGGGVRALLTLEVLKYIEQQLGKSVAQVADILVGTSTGSFVALGLGRKNGMSASQLSDTYAANAPAIFARSFWQKVSSAATLNGPKFDNQALHSCALNVLGVASKMSDGQCKLMATSYDIQKRTPLFLSSWDNPDLLMVDAVMASSAAPTYFPPWLNQVDGGVCNNSPALSGVIEACRLYNCTVRDVVCLSLGTGSDMRPYDGKAAADWGVLSWIEPLLSIFMDGTSSLHDFHLQRLLPDANVLRLQCEVAGDLAQLDNTAAANLVALQAAGRALVDLSRPKIDAFLQTL